MIKEGVTDLGELACHRGGCGVQISGRASDKSKQAALVLNASRRFRYTLDLKKEEEEKQQQLRNVRAHAQAIRAAYPEKEAGQKSNGTDNLKKEEEKQKVAFLVQETGRYVGWH
ncbi:hypothetical protein ACOSQ4_015785 [Xanthoceras sorbifolium]